MLRVLGRIYSAWKDIQSQKDSSIDAKTARDISVTVTRLRFAVSCAPSATILSSKSIVNV